MKIYINPPVSDWENLLKRPSLDNSNIETTVNTILNDVAINGDEALLKYTAQFDGVFLDDLQVSQKEIDEADTLISSELKKAIQQAAKNIELFHLQQKGEPQIIETMAGVQCWRKSVAIDKVGLYIPGGTAPLFSTLLMLGIPAKIAGCREIIVTTPPSKNGLIHPAILYAAKLIGINKIFKVGGVQAIAALAFGTKTIPKTYKIFGPGNQYVTLAKQLVQMKGTAIDMPAGPSEVCVWADEYANSSFVAADLLSQAEHGIDSQVILVSNSLNFINQVELDVQKQVASLNRKDIATKALENSKAFFIDTETNEIDLINEYAPEHLIIACENADFLSNKITNAGSIFLGNYSPESVGDYASGTNHTLPTNGFAKAYSGVSVDSFVKKITFQKLSKTGLQNIGPTVVEMANAEGLDGHANAVKIRLNN